MPRSQSYANFTVNCLLLSPLVSIRHNSSYLRPSFSLTSTLDDEELEECIFSTVTIIIKLLLKNHRNTESLPLATRKLQKEILKR